MKQVYIKDNGKKIFTDVTEETESVMTETRREIWRNDAKERYYRAASLSAMTDHDMRTSYAESPEDIYIAAEERIERKSKLTAALKTLTPEQAQLVNLVFVKNKPLKEIAEYYGITYQAVQNRLKKILEKLRKFF